MRAGSGAPNARSTSDRANEEDEESSGAARVPIVDVSEEGSGPHAPVAIPSTGTRSIHVVDLRDVPVVAKVLVFDGPGVERLRLELHTGANGRTEAELEPGQWVTAFTPEGRQGAVEVPEGTGPVGVRVYDSVALSGRVLDGNTDGPIMKATVHADRLGLPEALAERLAANVEREQRAVTNEDGGFEFTTFRPGRYRFEFSADGYAPYVHEGDWFPTKDWDMGAIRLEAVGPLNVRLVGFDPALRPSISFGRLGTRTMVDTEGRAVIDVPRAGSPQHFSVWLGNGSMMNVYQEGLLHEVEEVVVHVSRKRILEVLIEGEFSPAIAAMGEPSIRVRFANGPGFKVEWNRDLAAGPPYRTDCIDAPAASIDLVALDNGWPNVVATTTTTLEERGLNEVTLRVPSAVHRLAVQTADGAPLARDVFVELRRPHDAIRWLASAYPDEAGTVPWPDVPNAPELYCGGVFTWEPPESFFIDLPLPNRPGVGPQAPLALGPSRERRVRVVDGDQGVAGVRVQVLGRHTDQLWTFFETNADGWTEPFLVTEGSAVDYLVEDPSLVTPSPRVQSAGAATVVAVRRR